MHDFGICTSSASDLIRARFSAYASGDTRFIIDTTSVQSPDFEYYTSLPGSKEKNIKRWGRDITSSVIKDYFFVKVEVDSEALDAGEENVATVVFRHLAIQKGSNVMYPIQERATLVRDDGVVWKYVMGEVSRPPAEAAQSMMQRWPEERGMTLQALDRRNEAELDAQEQEEYYNDERGLLEGGDSNFCVDPRVRAAGAAAARVQEENRSRSRGPHGGAFAKGLHRR
jgi:uncharacterized protein YchJ